MIEGSLSDVSVPGLLQLLATESNKSFMVSLVSGGQKGDLLVCDGEILSANFGLLEGNDALTELLFWPEGSFSVALLNADEKGALKGNLKIALRQVNTFADQMVFLREAAVGLNSEIVPSLSFGTQAWQEALARQPLFKEDYAVLGWITDGRTMRQAMREFTFDVVKATSSLFRLLSTGSVEILRPILEVDEVGGEVPLSGLAAILDSMQPAEDAGATFDASPQAAEAEDSQAGEKGAAQENAQQPAQTQLDPSAKVDTQPVPKLYAQSVAKIDDRPAVKEDAQPVAKADVRSEAKAEAKTTAKIDAKATANADGDVAQKIDNQPVSKSDLQPAPKSESKDAATSKSEVKLRTATEPAPVAASRLVKNIDTSQQSSVGTATGATFNAVGGTMEVSAPAQPLNFNGDLDVITCDSLPAVGSDEFNQIMAKAQKAAEAPVDESAATSQAVTAQIHLPTSFRTSSDKIPIVTAGLAPDTLPIATAAAVARQTIDMDVPKLASSVNLPNASTSPNALPSPPSFPAKPPLVDSASAWAAAVRGEVPPGPAPVEETSEKRLLDIVRTDPLPIVAIDIERLFQTCFHVSPFGHVSLSNDALDQDLKKIIQDFKAGKNFITVVTEEQMLPAQVLHYCKYCLERGYIDPPDAVASLTADLLLDRVELEQYLLQRRRITGDELRDVMEVARQKGIKLTDLLVKLGFMTASDWDRLCQEKERFARR